MSGTDLTRIVDSIARPWISIPGYEGTLVKVIVADPELNKVVFQFKFAPGAVLPRHKHVCHAIAYTVAGEWEYEEGKLPLGSVAYEPYGSEHTPASPKGAELLVVLTSETDQFIENYLDDGSTFTLDMNFFLELAAVTAEEAATWGQ